MFGAVCTYEQRTYIISGVWRGDHMNITYFPSEGHFMICTTAYVEHAHIGGLGRGSGIVIMLHSNGSYRGSYLANN